MRTQIWQCVGTDVLTTRLARAGEVCAPGRAAEPPARAKRARVFIDGQ